MTATTPDPTKFGADSQTVGKGPGSLSYPAHAEASHQDSDEGKAISNGHESGVETAVSGSAPDSAQTGEPDPIAMGPNGTDSELPAGFGEGDTVPASPNPAQTDELAELLAGHNDWYYLRDERVYCCATCQVVITSTGAELGLGVERHQVDVLRAAGYGKRADSHDGNKHDGCFRCGDPYPCAAMVVDSLEREAEKWLKLYIEEAEKRPTYTRQQILDMWYEAESLVTFATALGITLTEPLSDVHSGPSGSSEGVQ